VFTDLIPYFLNGACATSLADGATLRIDAGAVTETGDLILLLADWWKIPSTAPATPLVHFVELRPTIERKSSYQHALRMTAGDWTVELDNDTDEDAFAAAQRCKDRLFNRDDYLAAIPRLLRDLGKPYDFRPWIDAISAVEIPKHDSTVREVVTIITVEIATGVRSTLRIAPGEAAPAGDVGTLTLARLWMNAQGTSLTPYRWAKQYEGVYLAGTHRVVEVSAVSVAGPIGKVNR